MNHKNWGGFDKQESCRSASGGSSSRSVMEKIEPVYQCCGKYPDRFPFQFVTSNGEQRRTGSHFFDFIKLFELFSDPKEDAASEKLTTQKL